MAKPQASPRPFNERRWFTVVMTAGALLRLVYILDYRTHGVYWDSMLLDAQIYEIRKKAVVLHVYVTDRLGTVLYDSTGRDTGKDYRGWRDVNLTLAGQYGARTTLADAHDPDSAVMYVGAAIRERAGPDADETIVGVVSVGKPVAAFSPFVANARQKLFVAGGVAAASFALLLLIVTV